MLEPHTPIPWTPATILHLAFEEDVLFAVLAANNHAKLLAALENMVEAATPVYESDGWVSCLQCDVEVRSCEGPDFPHGENCKFLAARDAIEDVKKAS